VRSVVIDTDMGTDDWMAILYLLKRQDVRVRAITVAGTGLAHCSPGVRNALGLLALVGRKGVPVACGRETPLRGARSFPAQWRRDADTMLGLALPKTAGRASRHSAVKVLAAAVHSAPGSVSLIALGPLTNIAEALREPALRRKINAVFIMGGAVSVPGNVDGSPAEGNFYVDPYAAEVVLRADTPVTLVPLDATNDVPVTRSFYDRLHRTPATRAAKFVYDVLTKQSHLIRSGEYFFWDPLTAAAFTDGSLIATERRKVQVLTSGPGAGSTRITNRGTPVRVAISANQARFERVLLSALS
jgi:pyrimidine-specific ribonucleoside hydrolase